HREQGLLDLPEEGLRLLQFAGPRLELGRKLGGAGAGLFGGGAGQSFALRSLLPASHRGLHLVELRAGGLGHGPRLGGFPLPFGVQGAGTQQRLGLVPQHDAQELEAVFRRGALRPGLGRLLEGIAAGREGGELGLGGPQAPAIREGDLGARVPASAADRGRPPWQGRRQGWGHCRGSATCSALHVVPVASRVHVNSEPNAFSGCLAAGGTRCECASSMSERFVLSNGLTVVFEEQHAAPVAAFQIWVRVGGADEQPDEAGLAHLHEHMLFKGSALRGPGELARDLEARGGEVNAWTSFDETVYHVVLASRFAREGLEALSDAVRTPRFDPEELAREIEVVCEEIKRSQDAPVRRASRLLFSHAYQGHPYANPVLGSAGSVRSFDAAAMRRFYETHYVPQNMVLSAVGDVTRAEIQEWAET